MLNATVLAIILVQGFLESPFNTYRVHLQRVERPTGCAPTDLEQFRNRTYQFRGARRHPGDQPVTLVAGRAVERNVLGSVEWETTLEYAEVIRLGETPAALLRLIANHLGGSGSAAYVLVVRCRPRDLQVLFEASGPIGHVEYSAGELTLIHAVWARDDSHAGPSREIVERYRWLTERQGFVLVEAIGRRRGQ